MNPNAIPVAILCVKGIITIVKKAGIELSIPSKSTFLTALIISTPTIISAGAVAAPGINNAIGDKNNAKINRIATTTAVRPVLPPSEIPVLLSKYVVTVDVPKHAPAVVAIASAIKALFIRITRPFFVDHTSTSSCSN